MSDLNGTSSSSDDDLSSTHEDFEEQYSDSEGDNQWEDLLTSADESLSFLESESEDIWQCPRLGWGQSPYQHFRQRMYRG